MIDDPGLAFRAWRRKRIVGVVLVAAALIALIVALEIVPQRSRLHDIQSDSETAWTKAMGLMEVTQKAQRVAEDFAAQKRELARREAMMAPNWDTYSWVLDSIDAFANSHEGVHVRAFSDPEVADRDIFPTFPYRWATFHVRGNACFYEFGVYLADLENSHPYLRVENLVMFPDASSDATPETLNISFDIVTPMLSTRSED